MKKQILFWVMMFCLIPYYLIAQNKYNHLVINQLSGRVKKITTKRQVYGIDPGYKNETNTAYFNAAGYITQSGEDIYKYNENYTQCTCYAHPGKAYEERCYLKKEETKNVCRYSAKYSQKMDGKWLDYFDIETVGIIFKFDDLNRLISHEQADFTGQFLLKLIFDWCFDKTYSYRGTEKLPYKVAEELDCGGDGWIYNLLIKYVSIDSKGNWTHRKLYIEENNELLLEETRTITYYENTDATIAASSKDNNFLSPIDPKYRPFRASAPGVIAKGDQFRVTFTMEGENLNDFKAPSTDGFEVLMGPVISLLIK